MDNGRSIAARLGVRLSDVVEVLVCLVASVELRRFDNSSSNVIFICPENYWGDLSVSSAHVKLK